ncbi:MAG: CBS domain-containing protein [Sphingobacteriaceae bacterium]|nr:CBS domain-containing protein [Sphingobacteriaceae bacterium]
MNERLEFLKTVKPFNVLPDDVLTGVADLLEVVKYKKDSIIYQQEVTKMKGVDLIVKGEYESFFYDSSQSKRSVEKHHEGYCFGGISVLLNKKRSLKTVLVKKGTVVYFLPRKDFRALCKAYDEFFKYFTGEFGKRMLEDDFAHFFKRPNSFEESFIASDQFYSRKIESIEVRDIVSCTVSTPIYQAARKMSECKTSCLFITNETAKIVGYVTDITLRDKVIATKGNAAEAVSSVMDNPIVAISQQAYVYEAVLMMFQTKTRYLLIESEGKYIGSISRNKLLSELAQSPLVFIQSVKQALSVEELKRKWETVPQIVSQLIGRGVNPEIVNQVITTIADTIAVKVIDNTIAEIGQPPAKFVFMVLGSEGRKEQTLKTDQDNAIIYEDKANEQRELVREYFLRFAQLVSERLNHIGFSFCTGELMAMNPRWTHSLSHWKRNYTSWIAESVPETAVNFSTFFDCRFIYGEEAIMTELHQFLDEELQKPLGALFYLLTKNALQYEPPLTFFRNIRTQTVGNQEVFDIKTAMTPIVDLVRVYALKERIFKVNTGERLKALKEKGVFSETAYHELSQSYYFLMGMRLKSQASQIIHDKRLPDNYIDLEKITKIEQVTLVEIFKTIENFQAKIKLEFTNSLW